MHLRLIAPIVILSLSATALSGQTAQAPDATAQAQAGSQAQSTGKTQESSVTAPKPSTGEDWASLPLAHSGLAVSRFNDLLLEKKEEPEFTRELVHVQWRPNDPIELFIVLPHGAVKPPVILYLYDYRFDTDRFRDSGWCKRAIQGGFAAVGFGSAFSPQRHHSGRPMKEWFVSELQEALGSSTHDVQMVLNYLASRGDVDTSRVGMFGQGSGGAIAVLAAAADSRVKALDLLNPWGDWPDWLKDSPQVPDEERAAYLKPEFLARVSDLDPVKYLPQLNLIKLRVQQIQDDAVTPPAASDKLASAAPRPEEVLRYKDAAAHYNAWRANGLSAWLREQLQPSAELGLSKAP